MICGFQPHTGTLQNRLACHASNLQSQAVAKKAGFVLEARLRGRELLGGQRDDELRFGLLRSEWEEIINLNQ